MLDVTSTTDGLLMLALVDARQTTAAVASGATFSTTTGIASIPELDIPRSDGTLASYSVELQLVASSDPLTLTVASIVPIGN